MKQTEKDLEKKLRDKAKALRRKGIQVCIAWQFTVYPIGL